MEDLVKGTWMFFFLPPSVDARAYVPILSLSMPVLSTTFLSLFLFFSPSCCVRCALSLSLSLSLFLSEMESHYDSFTVARFVSSSPFI